MLMIWIAAAAALADGTGLTLRPGYRAADRLASPHATQAAAADSTFVYAISNTTIAQYDRESGRLVRTATADGTKHLNSGFVHAGKVYCAHSNYPKTPHESDVRVFDPKAGTLTVHHTFADPPGSLVWCARKGDAWWCCFAHYGADNGKTVLVETDAKFRERRRWAFPPKVVADWDGMSASGGVWDGDTVLTTHHHFPVLYRLRVPKDGPVLEFVEALAGPFPGQGIAADPATGGLVGIDRPEREIVFGSRP